MGYGTGAYGTDPYGTGLPATADTETLGEAAGGLWSAFRYGWGCVYVLLIDGIPVVWMEGATTLTLPDGYAQDASLAIDRSNPIGSIVDRDTGIGAGLQLAWRLNDSTTAATWLRKPAHKTTLSGDLAVAGTSIAVGSTAGWAGDVAWCGLEAVHVSVASGTALAVAAGGRGYYGSQATAHTAGTLSGVVTDGPELWRGRGVTLYAVPCAPDGTIPSMDGTLLCEAEELWRGTISLGPWRDGGGFAFEALALDRVLATPLPLAATGVIADVNTLGIVGPWQSMTLTAKGLTAPAVTGDPWPVLWGPISATIAPFAVEAAMSPADQMTTIAAAWAAVADPRLGVLSWYKDKAGIYHPQFEIPIDVTSPSLADSVSYSLSSGPASYGSHAKSMSGGSSVGYTLAFPEWSAQAALLGPGASVAVRLDTPVDAVATPGRLVIDDGAQDVLFAQASVVGAVVHLMGLTSPATGLPVTLAADVIGKAAHFDWYREGALPDLALGMVRNGNTADTAGLGYGIRTLQVDADSFAALLKGGGLDATAILDGAGASFQDKFGGVLALAQRGCVARVCSDGRVRLAIVETSPTGPPSAIEIVDADLLSMSGEPVVSAQRRDEVAQVKVTLHNGPIIQAAQFAGTLALAGTQLEFTVPFDAPADAQGQIDARRPIEAWGAALIAQAPTLQLVELHVAPWVRAAVGDLVTLTLTHYALWQWSTGTPGFSGTARVLGATRHLLDGSQTLTILGDSAIRVTGLSMAARVVAFAGAAGAPTSIDIADPAGKYLAHLTTMLAESPAPLVLRHYQPGLEVDDDAHFEVTAAAVQMDGATRLCRLTTGAAINGATLSLALQSTLTLPVTGSGWDSPWQNLYAHDGDGSVWG